MEGAGEETSLGRVVRNERVGKKAKQRSGTVLVLKVYIWLLLNEQEGTEQIVIKIPAAM